MRRDYEDSALITRDGPFSGEMIKATGALCPDGIRRNAYPSTDGIADTYFSIPAFVRVRGVRVYGYVSVETFRGNVTAFSDDPVTVKFFPYLYRKHWSMVYAPMHAFATRVRLALANDFGFGYGGSFHMVPSSIVDTETEHDQIVSRMVRERMESTQCR